MKSFLSCGDGNIIVVHPRSVFILQNFHSKFRKLSLSCLKPTLSMYIQEQERKEVEVGRPTSQVTTPINTHHS